MRILTTETRRTLETSRAERGVRRTNRFSEGVATDDSFRKWSEAVLTALTAENAPLAGGGGRRTLVP